MTEKSVAVGAGPHEQMLRLVARGFYKELINYGVREPQILTVASHLLDNVLLKSPPESKPVESYNRIFRIGDVSNGWEETGRLSVQGVTVSPLRREHIPQLRDWLQTPRVRDSFHPQFPEAEEALALHFLDPHREYLAIHYEDAFVGTIGAETIDLASGKAEMRKLVGSSQMRGKGIGKRATFLFLYHAFAIRGYEKIYLHTLDANIRNLNLNSNFGFILEGVFFEDVVIDGTRRDVVRMALTEPAWRKMFM